MIRVILISALSFVVQATYGQSDSFGDWMVRMESGIEQHDKRRSNHQGNHSPSHLQADEKWGTYHLGLNLQREIIQKGILGIYGGIGLSYEKATFLRTFNHYHFFEGGADDLLRHQDRYRKVGAPINLNILLRLYKQLYITTDVRMNWLVYRSISNSNAIGSFGFPFTKSTLELNDINLRAGILYQIGNMCIGLNYRIENYQKIDEIIFDSAVQNLPNNERWESYNPLRFDLVVGYTWGRNKTDLIQDGQNLNLK